MPGPCGSPRDRASAIMSWNHGCPTIACGGNMSCPKCDAPLPEGSAFCAKCGTPVAGAARVSAAPGPVSQEPEQELWKGRFSGKAHGHRWILWVLWVGVLVVAFL